ncbi:helix-turn-helix domain-containing protein [Salinispora pacifica]
MSPGSRCRQDEAQLWRLADALEQGPAPHGFGSDQRWTLARLSELIARMFRTRYTLRGMANIMYRLSWSVQVPAHRAVERDEAAITRPSGSTGTSRRCQGCSHPPRHHPDQAAPSYINPLRQPKVVVSHLHSNQRHLTAQTECETEPKVRQVHVSWDDADTPVVPVPVSSKGSGRVSIAGLTCY